MHGPKRRLLFMPSNIIKYEDLHDLFMVIME